jgi:hypothetical protein
MDTNITIATFSNGETMTVASTPLYQYDYGQVLKVEGLELPNAYSVDFCNEGSDTSITQIGNADGVQIPDSLLTTGKNVIAYIFLHNEETDGETEYRITIFVYDRPDRDGEVPTPEQQSAIDQAIAALNAAGTKAEDAATAAEGYRDDSQNYATEAESWAVGGTGARDGEDTNNSRFWALVAQQGAEESGFAWFDINDQDGEMYVTITPNLDGDVKFEINESTGDLEVNVYG